MTPLPCANKDPLRYFQRRECPESVRHASSGPSHACARLQCSALEEAEVCPWTCLARQSPECECEGWSGWEARGKCGDAIGAQSQISFFYDNYQRIMPLGPHLDAVLICLCFSREHLSWIPREHLCFCERHTHLGLGCG